MSTDDLETNDPDQGDVSSRPGQARPGIGRTHGPTGEFIKTMDSARRDAKAAELRAAGWTYTAISDALGYGSRTNVMRTLNRMRQEIITPAVQELRDAEDAKLDVLEQSALTVLESRHLRFHEGEALTHEGEPVYDDRAVLDACTVLLKVSKARRELWGLDAPVKTDIGGSVIVKYELPGVDMGKV